MTIVFLHGWGCDKNIWKKQLEYFSPKHKCIAFDMSGFGEEPLNKPMTIFDYANEAAAKIEAEVKSNGEKVVLVGHSFGGRIAILLSALRPYLVKKTVLVAAAGVKNHSLKSRLKTYIYKSKKLLVRLRLLRPQSLPKGSRDYEAAQGYLKTTFVNVVNTDLTQYAKMIKLPTICVWGDKDVELPLSIGKKLARLTKSELITMENCGHFCFLEKPTLFNKIVEAFLQ